MLHYFSEVEFTNSANLQFALERVSHNHCHIPVSFDTSNDMSHDPSHDPSHDIMYG